MACGEGFKSVGYSRFGKDGSPFPMGSCHKAYTWALTGAPNLIKVYEEVFGIEKEAFLPTGMARLDHFLDPDHINSVKERFYGQWPQLSGKKVILFAPTFRGTGQKDAWYDYSRLDLKQIYDYCGQDTVFLVKMHPFVREAMPIWIIIRTGSWIFLLIRTLMSFFMSLTCLLQIIHQIFMNFLF